MRSTSLVLHLVVLLFAAQSLAAQTPARDPATRLRAVLPAEIADRVLATIADARARSLPAAALEQRALKFAAKGVDPALIARSVADHAMRMEQAKRVLDVARGRSADEEELEAGAEALRKGVNANALGDLVRAAPSGRSLAMPLYALGNLLDRGLPSDQAIRRVFERLSARAEDAEFQKMSNEAPSQLAPGQARKESTSADGATGRPANPAAAAGRGRGNSAVPGNAGKDARPTPKKPTTPPGRGRGGQ